LAINKEISLSFQQRAVISESTKVKYEIVKIK